MTRQFASRRRAGAGNRGPASPTTTPRAGSASTVSDGSPRQKKGKYNAAGRHVGKQWCASEAEAVRYEQLLEMQAKGLVSSLECQVPFVVHVNNVKICTYRCDFRFRWHGPEVRDPRGEVVVEEVKGSETPEWKLKCSLVEAIYGFKINVIRKLSGRDWDGRPDLAERLVGRKSSFAEQIKERYADRIADA